MNYSINLRFDFNLNRGDGELRQVSDAKFSNSSEAPPPGKGL
jgi:hypothetical protein